MTLAMAAVHPISSSTPASIAASPRPSAAPTQQTETNKPKFGKIVLDISNSVIPLERLNPTPSAKDGLSEESELQIRSLGCDLIQIAGKLLRLPQVAMATGCVLFHRFYYAKSFVRLPFDVVAMATLGLACKIEECPRRTRDIINVFKHIKQVRSGKPIQPVILDTNYSALKNQVIKAERRVLKELGFCVHVKHPHKIIVMYLKWLEQESNRELVQMSWNFMNDSLRTDVFVRYPPETIATACIYLSARRLGIPLPKSPAWFDVLGIEEDDIKDCCYRMICLYDRKKPNQDELESEVESLRKKLDESRRAAKEQNSNGPVSLVNSVNALASTISKEGSPQNENNGTKANYGDMIRKKSSGGGRSRSRSRSASKKRKKHKRSRSRSPSYDRDRNKKSSSYRHKHGRGSRSRSRSYSRSPITLKKSKKSHRDRSRDRMEDLRNGSRSSSSNKKRSRGDDRDHYRR